MQWGEHRRKWTRSRNFSGQLRTVEKSKLLWTVCSGWQRCRQTGEWFVKFKLACFRSLCRFFEKSRDLGRVHRLKIAGGVESLLKDRERITASDDDASGKISSRRFDSMGKRDGGICCHRRDDPIVRAIDQSVQIAGRDRPEYE
jgi:hypothetical protein